MDAGEIRIMKSWQWGLMMMVLCNIAYHVSGEDIMPLIMAPLFALMGFVVSALEADKEDKKDGK